MLIVSLSAVGCADLLGIEILNQRANRAANGHQAGLETKRVPCLDGQLSCELRCIDPLTDDQHCGATTDCLGENAGDVCSAATPCRDGVCGMPFPASYFPRTIPGVELGVTDMTRNAEGDLLFCLTPLGPGPRRVLEMSRSTGQIRIVGEITDTNLLLGIAYHEATDTVFVGSATPGSNGNSLVIAMDPDTGVWAHHALLDTLYGVGSMAVIPEGFGLHGGKLMVLAEDVLFVVDAETPNSATRFADLGQNQLSNQSDIAFAPDGLLYVIGERGLMVVDANGDWENLDNSIDGDGIAVDIARSRLIIAGGVSDGQTHPNLYGSLYSVGLPGRDIQLMGGYDFSLGSWPSGLMYDQLSTLVIVTGSSALVLEARELTD